MKSVRRPLALTAVAFTVAASLSGCSSPGKEAAEAVFNECHNATADPQLLRQDGKDVVLEVTGDAARTYAGAQDEIDSLDRENAEMDGIIVLMQIVMTSQCIAEATNYPGSYDQLRDGEEWDGWRFSEESGAGSEVTFTFTSTS